MKFFLSLSMFFLFYCIGFSESDTIKKMDDFQDYFNKHGMKGALMIFEEGIFEVQYGFKKGLSELLLHKVGIFSSPYFDWKESQNELCLNILEAKSEKNAAQAFALMKNYHAFINKRFILVIGSITNDKERENIGNIFKAAVVEMPEISDKKK